VHRLSRHTRPLALAVVAVAVVLVMFLLVFGSNPARDSFWSQLGATLTAVIVGVPVALLLAWWQQQAERNAREEEAGKLRSRAADDLLGVIAAELQDTWTALDTDTVGPTADQAHAPPAVSSLLDHLGGDRVSVIEDPETIRAVSLAYDHIAAWRDRRRTLYQVGLDSFAGNVEHVFMGRVREHLFAEQNRTNAAISYALDRIDMRRTTHPVESEAPRVEPTP